VEQIHERVAGLDVHRDSVVASFRQAGPRGGVVREKERFTTTTAGLGVLGGWLGDRQVQLVAIEATGVYWKPVVRHEVPRVRAEVKGLRLRPVAAGR
jgi:transposase